MDTTLMVTIIGTGVGAVALIYGFLRNFKSDINSHIDRLDANFQKMEKEWKEESRKMDQRVLEINRRMDGVYNVLLKRLEKSES